MFVRTPLTVITNCRGTVFAVRLVPVGGVSTMGRDTHPDAVVEFFDTANADDSGGTGREGSGHGGHGYGVLGQFVDEFPLSSLLHVMETGQGVPRPGGVASREVDTATIVAVVRWLVDAAPEVLAASREHKAHREEQARMAGQARAAMRLPQAVAEARQARRD